MNTPSTRLTQPEAPQVGLLRWGTDLERFRRYYRIDPSGCWIWTGCFYTFRGEPSYGQSSLGGKRMGAHRVSYILHVGPIPDGLDILHSCDVKSCVQPLHLRPGTHRENIAEARERHGEWSLYGEAHGRARLTQIQVDAIREAVGRGVRSRDLAAEYGISQGYVRALARGVRWNVDREAVA